MSFEDVLRENIAASTSRKIYAATMVELQLLCQLQDRRAIDLITMFIADRHKGKQNEGG